MPKTVTIDARWLVGGIGTYTRNLLQEFHKCANRFEIQAIVRKRDFGSVQGFCPVLTVIDAPIYTLSEQWLIARASRRARPLGDRVLRAPRALAAMRKTTAPTPPRTRNKPVRFGRCAATPPRVVAKAAPWFDPAVLSP